jgi:hypothetical protein
MTEEYKQTLATIYEIKGMLTYETCQLANKILNKDIYSKIIETKYDDYSHKRIYITVKSDEPYIKYVGLNIIIPDKLVDDRFRVGYDYSIVNIKSIHKIILPELKTDDSEFIGNTDIYKFIKSSGINYSIVKNDNNSYTFHLMYDDLNFVILKSKLSNLLPI